MGGFSMEEIAIFCFMNTCKKSEFSLFSMKIHFLSLLRFQRMLHIDLSNRWVFTQSFQDAFYFISGFFKCAFPGIVLIA